MLFIVIVIVAAAALVILSLKLIHRKRLSSLFDLYHQGLIHENGNNYPEALEIYSSLVAKYQNTPLANDPFVQKIRERLKTLRSQMDFEQQSDRPLGKW